ncbi:RNA 3'-terminal phosphate cyclase [Halorussus salinisoli]|uniref:RNA 3'-terminal phosphate cyclase n=1 Tax=Halorussus salinisoli TaxID=2558242 RepID=UPI002A9185D1|nr:RNA 3'-terminal phosphate cyclase [Halorussus salinisoli]
MTEDELLELDGSAGGGQLLRTALALSMVADRSFRMENVRGDRPTPGLKPQHLAAVRAAAEVCDASVSGAEQGSEEVEFRPGSPSGGRVEIDVGTAGSVTLLFDALLPVALRLDRPLAVTATGGTDVKWSPTVAHYRQVKLPLVRKAGVFAAVDRTRTGFYPVGGGEATLFLAPSSPSPLDLTERGSLDGARIFSKASADLSDAEVAERQAAVAAERLQAVDRLRPDERLSEDVHDVSDEVSVTEKTVSSVETDSPGSALALALDYEEATAGFDALGERGRPARAVGAEAVESALTFHGSRGAVDAHTADQLVVFLALAGGRVAIPEVTDHVRTGADLVSEFGFPVELQGSDPPMLTAPAPEPE